MKINTKAAKLREQGLKKADALDKVKALVKKAAGRWTKKSLVQFEEGWLSAKPAKAAKLTKGVTRLKSAPVKRLKGAAPSRLKVMKKAKPTKVATPTKVLKPVVLDKGVGYNASTKEMIKAAILILGWKKGLPISELKIVVKELLPKVIKFTNSMGMDNSEFSKVLNLILADRPYAESRHSEMITNSASSLKETIPTLRIAEHDIHEQYISLLSASISVIIKDSGTALAKLVSGAAILKDNAVSKVFLSFGVKHAPEGSAVSAAAQDKLYKQLVSVSAKIGADEYFGITAEGRAKANAEQKETVKKFNELLKQYHAIYLFYVKKFVVESGGHLLKTEELRKKFKTAGLRDRLPVGFVGQVDEKGALYTSGGLALAAHSTAKAVMNPKYHPVHAPSVYYVDFKKPNGKSGRTYTLHHVGGKREDKKEDAIAPFIANVEKYRSKWMTPLKAKDNSLKKIQSAMTEIIWQLALRIGSGVDAASKKEKTQGFTTVKSENITIEPNGIRFKYVGKDGIAVNSVFTIKAGNYQNYTSAEAKLAIDVVKELLKGKEKGDYVFMFEGKRVSSDSINKFLKAIGMPKGFLSHKFRHSRATLIAKEEFIGLKKQFKAIDPNNKKQVDVFVKEIEESLKKVGAILGHVSGDKVTGKTAVKNYVSPKIVKELFTDLGVKMPAAMAKSLRRRSNTAEASDAPVGTRVEVKASSSSETASSSDNRVERTIRVNILPAKC